MLTFELKFIISANPYPFQPMNIKMGVIGTGGFTHFSVSAFRKNSQLAVAGAFDIRQEALNSFCAKFDCRGYDSEESLLRDPAIQLVYIASPPFLHHTQSRNALMAGKHVICEKPAAMKAAEVEELITLARERDLLYVVNLMQRYNPMYHQVQELVEGELLGEFLHGYFENYASDETLDENHWMWDEKMSGGIFIEHAVHFFDMLEGWLGPGVCVAAQKVKKKGMSKEIWPEVQAICLYRNGLFNFYHGFHQANRMDRQELKLVFANGEITLYEWVPARMVVKGLITEEKLASLQAIFPEADTEIVERFTGDARQYRNHFQDHKADLRVIMREGDDSRKLTIYQYLLEEIIRDQIKWLQDRTHKRKITEVNALHSVRMAENADKLAIRI